MTSNPFPVWINGEAQEQVPVTDRGLAYGDGVFETLRLEPQPVLEGFHLERLLLGLKTLQIPADMEKVQDQLHRYIEVFSPGVVKIIITRGSGGRGYLPPDEPLVRIILQGFPVPEYPSSCYNNGISLHLCDTHLSQHPVLSGIKHLNRLEQVMARGEFAGTSRMEGLMGNSCGWIEGTMSNLFLIRDETLCTPSLAAMAVKGTMQRFVLETCRQQDYPVKEMDKVTTADLQNADRVFVCNSVFGFWPVNALMDEPLAAKPSVLFNHLQQQVMSLIQ